MTPNVFASLHKMLDLEAQRGYRNDAVVGGFERYAEQWQRQADSAISEASSQGQRKVEEMKVDLQRLRNQSEVTLAAEANRKSAEIIAQGEGQAMETVQQTHNDLLEQRVQLLKEYGDIGKIALFYNKLPSLFDAYQRHAQTQSVDQLLVLNEEEGFNSAVNRGPAAMVDFLQQLETGFGVSVRDLMSQEA
jgi:vacuolar-type H+-ATPase subunit H